MKKTLTRTDEIVKLKESGFTQQEIAEKFGISRQRVQQIEASLGLDRKKDKVLFAHDCNKCRDSFSSRQEKRKYCSKSCSAEGRKIERTPEEMEAHVKEIKERKRIRANEYYYEVIKKRK